MVERSKIARQIHEARRVERSPDVYCNNRNMNKYLRAFYGLRHYFDHVRSSQSPTVLDIGSGEMVGVGELQTSIMGQDLQFASTVLVAPTKPSPIPYTITSAEVLRGFQDASIGGILALNSISYSTSSKTIAKSLDRILVPGGVIKATFCTIQPTTLRRMFNEEIDNFRAFAFAYELVKRGYDVARYYKNDTERNPRREDIGIVLGIKPGGAHETSAQRLLDFDIEDYNRYLRQIIGIDRKGRRRSIEDLVEPDSVYLEWANKQFSTGHEN